MSFNYERDRVQKIIQLRAVENVLTYEPVPIGKIISRVGHIPILKTGLSLDAARRILVTLEELGEAKYEKGRGWSKGHKS